MLTKGEISKYFTILFQPIPPVLANGPIQHIQINFTSKDYIDSVIVPDVTATLTAKQLSCNKSYNVTLQVRNNIGISLQPSSFMITSANNGKFGSSIA